eukprot:UN30766
MLTGNLEGISAGLAMHSEGRFGAGGVRMRFNGCQHGSTLDCGSTWRLMNMFTGHEYQQSTFGGRNDDRNPESHSYIPFYLALTGRPLTLWDMMELNFCDWAWPHKDGIRAFHYIGEKVDYTMRNLFWEQDKYTIRTYLKSFVELYDRGTEFYKSPIMNRSHLKNTLDDVLYVFKQDVKNLINSSDN